MLTPSTSREYCYALHPKANTQSTKIPFREYLWTGPYIVVKVLPNNNYLIRKLQKNYTQILHRIRLKRCPTDKPVLPKDYIPDEEVDVFHDDLYAQAWQSTSEDFTTVPNPPFQIEPTVTVPESLEEQLTQTDTLPPDPGEPPSAPDPDERRIDTVPSVRSDNPENEKNGPPPPPIHLGKINTTCEQTPHQTGKRIMRLITH